jgi:hypothetical protein
MATLLLLGARFRRQPLGPEGATLTGKRGLRPSRTGCRCHECRDALAVSVTGESESFEKCELVCFDDYLATRPIDGAGRPSFVKRNIVGGARVCARCAIAETGLGEQLIYLNALSFVLPQKGQRCGDP